MDRQALISLAERLIAGKLTPTHFVTEVKACAFAQTGDADLDLNRVQRCGYPEVVYAEGKTIPSLLQIIEQLNDAGQPVLATRVSHQQAEAALQAFAMPEETAPRDTASPSDPGSSPIPTCAPLKYNAMARTLRIGSMPPRSNPCNVAVVSAGTSDRPIAEEAVETLRWMGVPHHLLQDVGVAGPHRLPAHRDRLRAAAAVVVVAGMEGALPSVVGGYTASPVIAVPTSVGYGASFGGVAALLGMLNSCAANVTVVNIDAGFKAGYLAGLIANQSHPPTHELPG